MKKTIILGQQLAAAKMAEAERIARGDSGSSPLRPEDRYDQFLGQFGLYDPVQLPLDDRIGALCHDFACRDADGRLAMRRSLSLEDLYTLLTFSRRCAVFGLRTRDPRWLVDGLTAIAMLEIARVDYRDAPGPMFLIAAAFRYLCVDSNRPFADAAGLAEHAVSELLLSFRDRPANHHEFRAACYELVESPGGPGLISRGGSKYNPTLPLDRVILQIAQLLRDDQYASSVEIATELPDFWLSSVDDRALARALGTAVAGATAHATPRPHEGIDDRGNFVFVFLVETAAEGAAKTLHQIALRKRDQKNDFAMVAARSGKLFCLLIARVFIAGDRPFETTESVLRFLPGIEKILRASAEDDSAPQATRPSGPWRSLIDKLLGR